jgi:hypothetical protein
MAMRAMPADPGPVPDRRGGGRRADMPPVIREPVLRLNREEQKR